MLPTFLAVSSEISQACDHCVGDTVCSPWVSYGIDHNDLLISVFVSRLLHHVCSGRTVPSGSNHATTTASSRHTSPQANNRSSTATTGGALASNEKSANRNSNSNWTDTAEQYSISPPKFGQPFSLSKSSARGASASAKVRCLHHSMS